MSIGAMFRGALAGLFAFATPGLAAASCAEAPDTVDPGVFVIQCDGALLAVEASAVRSPGALINAHPHAIQLDEGALAVALTSSAAPFSTLTPDAVVSARDGEWSVVVEGRRTSAAAWRGSVTMLRRAGGAETALTLSSPDSAEPRLARLRQALSRAQR